MLESLKKSKPNEWDVLQLSKDYFLPAIHNVYHLFYLESYLENRKKWPLLARTEFPEQKKISLEFEFVDQVSSTGITPPFGNSELLKGGLFCQVFRVQDQLLIVFRGSAGLLDWLRNSLAYMVPIHEENEEVKVHAGFLQVFQDLRGFFDTYESENCWIVGHSLGGAVANLLAQDKAFKNCKLVTFGSPRVGNSEFVASLEENTSLFTRIETEGDPIPYLPIEVKRIGGLFDYTAGGNLLILPLPSNTIVEKLKAHLPSLYLQSVEARLHS